jgi:hypothetical protein
MSASAVLKSSELRHARVSHIRVADIEPSAENLQLYKPVDPDDPEILALAESIRTHGVKVPLVITLDNYILSGHRRYVAATLAGLEEVPCVVEQIYRFEDEFLPLLREYNRQRVKSIDEVLREEIVSAADPEEAYQSLIEERKAKSAIKVKTIEIVGTKTRCEISEAKHPFVEAIKKVMNKLREIWPLSDRTIHYGLLNHRVLKHAGKPDSIYCNDKASYNSLTELLTRMRLSGVIPFESISDDTRPIQTWNVHANTAPFIRSEMDEFLKGYWRDLMQSQPCHIEIVGEKNTIAGIIKPVAARYCIPMTLGRGYCSLRPRYDMQQRFLRSGKGKLVVLILSDFDPDGIEISHSFTRSMRDDFGVPVEGVQVALTAAQVRRFKLPPKMTAKEGSAHHDKFTKKHGQNVFELEAISPKQLQKLLTDAIDRVIDTDIFNAELNAEKADAAFLEDTRREVRRALAKIGRGE